MRGGGRGGVRGGEEGEERERKGKWHEPFCVVTRCMHIQMTPHAAYAL